MSGEGRARQDSVAALGGTAGQREAQIWEAVRGWHTAPTVSSGGGGGKGEAAGLGDTGAPCAAGC